MNNLQDTIVAQVTPRGKSGVSILRISGKHASKVSVQIFKKVLKPRYAEYLSFFDKNNNVLDHVIGIWFPAPSSFTGEDVLEIQGHGNPILVDLLLKTILTIGDVRIAEPGEFSKRAFLNGKIDLIQAEAIADLINAESEQLVRASLNSMQGHFSLYIQQILRKIISIRTIIESVLNFEEVNNDILFENSLDKKLENLLFLLKKIIKMASYGSVLREGMKITIIGPPNTGKSSLINALSFKDISIVTNIKGTTRDIIREHININGYMFSFIDTAGLRKTKNKIELIGIKKAWKEVNQSNHVLYVLDISKIHKKSHDFYLKKIPSNISFTIILNKCDLLKQNVELKTVNKIDYISLSAKKNIGIHFLQKYLIKKCIYNNTSQVEGVFSARSRHLFFLKKSLSSIIEGKNIWTKTKSVELLAEHIYKSHMFLTNITGSFTSENLLNHIFSSFCIGK